MRKPGWLLQAFGAALVVNLLMLVMAAFLGREQHVEKQDMTAPTGVNLINLAAPEEPVEEEVSEPQKPPQEQEKPDVSPDLFQPDFAPEFAALGAAAGEGVVINLSGGSSSVMKNDFVFESYELDQAPRAVVKTPPLYPMRAREQGVEGVVQVKILVREDGTVGEVIIMDSRPRDVFDDAVLNAVPRWRFEPGVIGGKKVTSWVVTALHFKLG